MGIGYDAQIVLYNCTGGEIGIPKTWYGTLINSVRVDLKKSVNIGENGSESANMAKFGFYDKDLPKDPLEPEIWRLLDDRGFYLTFDDTSYIVITYKPDIGAKHLQAPIGTISDADYDTGLIEWLKMHGHVYRITAAEHYSLIPHWEITAA